MATADEQKREQMVDDHEARIRALERDVAELKPPKDDKTRK